VALDETPTTQGSLLSVLLRSPAALGILDYGLPAGAAALSPDGRLMAIGDAAGKLTLYRAKTRQPVGRPYRIPEGFIQSLRFSPDGRSLAVGSRDPTDLLQAAVVDVIDPRTGKLRLRVELPPRRERAEFVEAAVEFLPNSRDMVVASVHGSFPDSPATLLYRVNGDSGAIESELRVGEYGARALSITADGERVFLTSPREDRSWEIDPERLEIVRTYEAGDFSGAVSPDGRVLGLGSRTGQIRLLDLRSGEVRSFSGRHGGGVQSMSFTPDGRTLVTAGNARVTVWDVTRGAIMERLGGHSGSIWGLDISPDGRTALSAAHDGRAILWDLAGDRRLDRRFSVRGYRDSLDVWFVVDVARGVAVSPDGRTLAVTHIDGTVELLDTATLKRRRAFRAIRGFAGSASFSPDGRLLAVAGEGGRITLWDVRTRARAGELEGLRADSQALAFSPGGRLLAAAEAGFQPPRMRIWDVRRRAQTRFAASITASALAFSPDETLVAAANGLDTADGAEIFDAQSGAEVKFVETPEPTRSVAFSPDGSLLVVGLFDGTVRFFSTDAWKRVGSPFEAHAGIVMSTSFSPDGRVLATSGADGTVALWDVATRKPIGTPVTVAPDTMVTAAFSPDGSHLFAVSTSGEGIRLDASPQSWKRRACGVAGRDLTAREWEDALPDRPYRAVCSGD
jgi:WD40 repeat protein